MPSPVLIVGGVIIAVGAGFAFKQFVYDPYLSDKVHVWVEDFSHRRRMHRHPADPHPASPPPRGKSPATDPFDEKRSPIGDSTDEAGTSTGTEMREVSLASSSLRRRGAPFQRNTSELEMDVIGDSFLLDDLDTPTAAWQSSQQPEVTRQQSSIPPAPPFYNLPDPFRAHLPTPSVTRSTAPATPQRAPSPSSPRSPFSDLRALSEISFDAASSSDPFEEHQRFSPPPAGAAVSPPSAVATFSPFVVPNVADPLVDVDVEVSAASQSPFVDVSSSERPTSPWSELSAHSGATAGQLHLRLSRTDTDSEKDGSESGSDGSWEHT